MADPFTSLGIAASIAQFVTIALHVGNRIREFSAARVQLSKSLKEISERLAVLMDCLRRIEQDSKLPGASYSLETLNHLNALISGCTDRTEELQRILDKYLPKKDGSFLSKTKSALKSFERDSKINEISRGLAEDIRFLTLHLVTTKGNLHEHAETLKNNTPNVMCTSIYDFPHHKAARFLGRAEELSQLESNMNEPSEAEPRVVVLQGLGGQGKTQIALEYCHRAKRAKKFPLIFWVNANSETSLRNSFEAIAESLKPPEQVFPDINSRVNFVMRILGACSQSWLMVFDNYDDLKGFPNVTEFFPTSEKGNIILTSRAPGTCRVATAGHFIEVFGMNSVDAVSFLLITIGLEKSEENVKEAEKVVERLGRLPLAIDQAGSYIRDRRSLLTLASFLENYHDEMESILSEVPDVWDYLETSTEGQKANSRSVFTTWELSFRLLMPKTELGMKKADFVNLLGFLNPQNISEELFSTYCHERLPSSEPAPWMSLFVDHSGNWCSSKFETVILELKKLSLVTSVSRGTTLGDYAVVLNTENKNTLSRIPSHPNSLEPSKGGTAFLHLSLHPLVSDWIHLRLKPDQRRRSFVLSSTLLSTLLTQPFSEEKSGVYYNFKMPVTSRNEHIPHVIAWTLIFKKYYRGLGQPVLINTRYSEVRSVESCFAFFLDNCDIIPECIELCEWLWNHTNSSDKNQQKIKFHAGLLWSECLIATGSNTMIITAKEILDYWESTLDREDAMLQRCRYTWVMALKEKERNDEAESMCRKIIQCSRNSDPFYDRYLIELAASLLLKNPQSMEGLDVINNLMSLAKKSSTIVHGSTSWNRRSWGIMIKFYPEIKTRVELARELLSTMRSTYGEGLSITVFVKKDLSEVLYAQGDYDRAEYWIRQCIDASQNFTPRQDSDLSNKFELAKILIAQKDEAKQLEARSIICQVLPMMAVRDTIQDSRRGYWLGIASGVLMKLGEYGKAEEVCLKLVALSIKQGAKITTTTLIANYLRFVVAKFHLGSPEKLAEAREILHEVAITHGGAIQDEDGGHLSFDGLDPTMKLGGWHLADIPIFLSITEIKLGMYEEGLRNFNHGTALFNEIFMKEPKFIENFLGMILYNVRYLWTDSEGYVHDDDQEGLKHIIQFLAWGTAQAGELLGAEHNITKGLLHDHKGYSSYIKEKKTLPRTWMKTTKNTLAILRR